MPRWDTLALQDLIPVTVPLSLPQKNRPVEVLDRPIFLRRWQRDRDWDQMLNVSSAAFDSYQLSRVLDTRAGNNTLNHQDKEVDALIDRMRAAPTDEALLQAGQEFQHYVTGIMLTCGIASLPFLQAARTDVKGYVYLRVQGPF